MAGACAAFVAVKSSTLLSAHSISVPEVFAGPTEASRDACPPKHSQRGQSQGLCLT